VVAVIGPGELRLEATEAIRVAGAVDATRRSGAVDGATRICRPGGRRNVLRVERRVEVVRLLGTETVSAVDLGLVARVQIADATDVALVGGDVVLDGHVDLRGRHRRVARVDL